MIARWRQLIIRSELQQPMRKTISYKMNLAWQTDDKLFMFSHEERRLASTVVCGGCRGGPDRSSREKRNVGSRRRGNAAVLLAGHAGETKSPCRFDPLRLLGHRFRWISGMLCGPPHLPQPVLVARESPFLAAYHCPRSLPSSLCSSQHHRRPPSRLFVVSHHALRLLRLVRCQIVRPPKPDRLIPKLRLHLERSRCIPG